MLVDKKWFQLFNLIVALVLLLLAMVYQFVERYDRAAVCLLWSIVCRMNFTQFDSKKEEQ